jgi:ATP synthase F1 complex assembly factor 2
LHIFEFFLLNIFRPLYIILIVILTYKCSYFPAKKRFYREVSVVHEGTTGQFEVCLDGRKIKTPLGKPFKVEGEALALAVAQEWSAQKEQIMTQQMHLTGLANVCVDNPTNAGPEEMAEGVLAFLDTDTLLFISAEDEALAELQRQRWLPIIDWFCHFHGGLDIIQPSRSLSPPVVAPAARQAVQRHLLSHSNPCLHALAFGADALKSTILMTALAERRLRVEEAVALARLEVQFQVGHFIYSCGKNRITFHLEGKNNIFA